MESEVIDTSSTRKLVESKELKPYMLVEYLPIGKPVGGQPGQSWNVQCAGESAVCRTCRQGAALGLGKGWRTFAQRVGLSVGQMVMVYQVGEEKSLVLETQGPATPPAGSATADAKPGTSGVADGVQPQQNGRLASGEREAAAGPQAVGEPAEGSRSEAAELPSEAPASMQPQRRRGADAKRVRMDGSEGNAGEEDGPSPATSEQPELPLAKRRKSRLATKERQPSAAPEPAGMAGSAASMPLEPITAVQLPALPSRRLTHTDVAAGSLNITNMIQHPQLAWWIRRQKGFGTPDVGRLWAEEAPLVTLVDSDGEQFVTTLHRNDSGNMLSLRGLGVVYTKHNVQAEPTMIWLKSQMQDGGQSAGVLLFYIAPRDAPDAVHARPRAKDSPPGSPARAARQGAAKPSRKPRAAARGAAADTPPNGALLPRPRLRSSSREEGALRAGAGSGVSVAEETMAVDVLQMLSDMPWEIRQEEAQPAAHAPPPEPCAARAAPQVEAAGDGDGSDLERGLAAAAGQFVSAIVEQVGAHVERRLRTAQGRGGDCAACSPMVATGCHESASLAARLERVEASLDRLLAPGACGAGNDKSAKTEGGPGGEFSSRLDKVEQLLQRLERQQGVRAADSSSGAVAGGGHGATASARPSALEDGSPGGAALAKPASSRDAARRVPSGPAASCMAPALPQAYTAVVGAPLAATPSADRELPAVRAS